MSLSANTCNKRTPALPTQLHWQQRHPSRSWERSKQSSSLRKHGLYL